MPDRQSRQQRLTIIALALLLLPVSLIAQLPATPHLSTASLSNSAGPYTGDPTPAALASTASLTGLVADITGAIVPGARVSLTASGSDTPERTISADSAGQFNIAGLPPGTYALSVSSPGLQTFTVLPIVLQAGDRRELSNINLSISSARIDVQVNLTRQERAALEVHDAEQQRVLGAFPNFYTSFMWNAAPLDTGQKFNLALHATTDKMAFITAGLVAVGEQAQNTFPAYGQGMQGFAKRYGAAYADGFTGKIIGSALLPSIFRQDPRYFYMGHGTVRRRALHAIASAILVRGDNGRTELNYSHILGNASAGAISTLYHPATDSAGKLALDNALLGTLGEAGVNLCREFLLHPFTRGIPAYAHGEQ
jgi:hypothetical protein